MISPFEMSEAAAILRRLVTAIGEASRNSASASAAELRQFVGVVRANPDNAIRTTLGTTLARGFRLAREAGAAFQDIERVRALAVAEAPVSVIGTIVAGAVVQQALACMARIAADMEFESRNEVESVRALLSAAFDDAEDDAADEQDSATYQTLMTLHAAAVRDLTARARPLPSMIRYSYAIRFPALWIANRLYGDGSRYAELIAENRPVHPLFMPPEGRALSR